MHAGARQFGFMVRGLQHLEQSLGKLHIPFFLLKGADQGAVVAGLHEQDTLGGGGWEGIGRLRQTSVVAQFPSPEDALAGAEAPPYASQGTLSRTSPGS